MPEANTDPDNRARTGALIRPPDMVKDKRGKRPSRRHRQPKPTGPRGYLAILVLAILVFAPMLQSDLLWTEHDQVERTPYTSMERWTEAWTIESIRDNDPLTLTSLFAEELLPLPPGTRHRAINLTLHLIAAFLLLKILEALKLPGALAATLVFTLHPSVVQTLFWAGYRHEITALVLILLAIYFGLRNRNTADFLLMLGLTVIASMAHPAALALPLILGLCIFYREKRFNLADYNRLLPLFCAVVFIGAWNNSGAQESPGQDAWSPLSILGTNLFFYLRQSLLPIELALFHPLGANEDFALGAESSILPVLAFLGPVYLIALFNYRKKWARGGLLGISACVALLAHRAGETGSFIDGTPAGEAHALYIALPIIVATVFCSGAAISRRMGPSIQVLWTVGLSLLLILQIGLSATFSYRLSNRAQLWMHLSEQWPDSSLAKTALVEAVIESESDLLSKVQIIETLEEILEKNPDQLAERILLARRYRDIGHRNNAAREYRRILRESEPDDDFLEEAADLFDQSGLTWEANNARERMTQN